MNNETVKQEITNLLSNVRQPSYKQYPVAKHQIATLTELSLIELMPAGFGYTDAAIVIEAAQEGESAVFNQTGEGESVPASKMNKLISEVEELTAEQLTLGMEIAVKQDATIHDYSVPGGYGTLVEPVVRPHPQRGQVVSIRALYNDGMDNELGNIINEIAIDTSAGMFCLDDIELITQ